MKQFFYLVFGGLSAVGAGVGIAYGGSIVWRLAEPKIAKLDIPSFTEVTQAIVSSPTDGTSISGITRTVRFSANEEEDLINAAAYSLPSGADPKVTASAYVVRNLSGKTDAAMFNADRLMPIASLTKLVTAVVAGKLIDPESRITITRDIMATYGNTAGFKVGESFRAADLMYPLLMVSSNDASEAFAQSYGRARFIAAMNDFVQSIGAYRTEFEDPSGLSPKNVSTADDLATIIDWIRINHPEIIAMTELKSKVVRTHTWINPTHFLNWSNYLGGKNGYTTEADRTGVALFSMGKAKDTYAVIILGSDARDADVIKLLAKIR